MGQRDERFLANHVSHSRLLHRSHHLVRDHRRSPSDTEWTAQQKGLAESQIRSAGRWNRCNPSSRRPAQSLRTSRRLKLALC